MYFPSPITSVSIRRSSEKVWIQDNKKVVSCVLVVSESGKLHVIEGSVRGTRRGLKYSCHIHF